MQKALAEKRLKLLGQRIRALRHAQNLSQEELAERAEVHVTYLSALECGKRNPSMAIFFSLAHALKIAPGELLRFPVARENKRRSQ
jgi:transcriptional regulator with XRE-family HTH domain